VGTAVSKDVYLSVRVAGYDHGTVANMRSDILARLCELTFVYHKNPGAAEDALHFGVENLRIGINPAVDSAFGCKVTISVCHERNKSILMRSRKCSKALVDIAQPLYAACETITKDRE
jgi:hypothetical protein